MQRTRAIGSRPFFDDFRYFLEHAGIPMGCHLVVVIHQFLDVRVIGQTMLHMQIEPCCRQFFLLNGLLCQRCNDADHIRICARLML